MALTSPLPTVGVGLALLLVAYLVRERGWTFLIAGVHTGELAFPELVGEVVGTYTAVVGVGTVCLGVLAFLDLAPEPLWQLYGGVVAVSAITLPFWAPRYARWRFERSSAA